MYLCYKNKRVGLGMCVCLGGAGWVEVILIKSWLGKRQLFQFICCHDSIIIFLFPTFFTLLLDCSHLFTLFH